jgi:predicted transcriptional regulator
MHQPAKETLSFVIESKKREKLDKIAEAQDRDRSHVIRVAIDTYISLEEGHVAHIREGLRQAEAGEVVDHVQVKKWVESLGTRNELPRPTAQKRKRRT